MGFDCIPLQPAGYFVTWVMAEANSSAAKDADGSEQPNDAKQRRKTFAEKRKEPLRAEIGRLVSNDVQKCMYSSVFVYNNSE